VARIRVGISGWTYPPWRGDFYPKGLPHKLELHYASRKFTTIEINGTFYSLQRPSSFAKWREQTPDDFVFSMKGSRFITHMKRLMDASDTLANYFASGPLILGPKLGPILWQLPPNMPYERQRLEQFFMVLPRTTVAAAKLAERHDERLKHGAHTTTEANRPLRYAVEVRHESYNTPEFLTLLREHDIAVVIADTAGKWPQIEEITSDFGYVRLHGAEELYTSGYTDNALDEWAAKVRGWSNGKRDMFVYFDNDVKGYAPWDAMKLIKRLSDGAES
jgi:uncharacterized protein YecE (DUF72 family)